MRVCFVLPDGGLSGGAAVVLGHARRLAAEHGAEVDLVLANGGDSELDGLPVRRLAEAANERYDVAIATWWETAYVLWELDARRRALFLQSFEQRFYDVGAPFERLAAEAVLTLPLDYVAVASWLCETLRELRPQARCRVVRPGIDKEVFSADRVVRRDAPLRVLVEGQPSLPFKGVGEALAAVRAMQGPVDVTVVALDPSAAGDVVADRVVGGLDAAGMAELYRESDVLLKLSRVEGLGLAPVEGFHSGLPCVITPYTGHEEYAVHGENCLVVAFDDVDGTAAALDRLAGDRDLLARLSEGARRTAEGWPDSASSTAALHAALAEIAESEPSHTDVPLLLNTLRLHLELGRGSRSRLEAVERALAEAQVHFQELSDSRDECSGLLDEANAELRRIRGSAAYRAASAARRAGSRITRGRRSP